MTTADNISFQPIRSFRAGAANAGDFDAVAICDLALNGEIDVDDYTALTIKGATRLRTMTREQAYAEIAEMMNDAEAARS